MRSLFGFTFGWKYRARDCKHKTTRYYTSLYDVYADIEVSDFCKNLLEMGLSVSDGKRYKVDVKGSYSDGTWGF